MICLNYSCSVEEVCVAVNALDPLDNFSQDLYKGYHYTFPLYVKFWEKCYYIDFATLYLQNVCEVKMVQRAENPEEMKEMPSERKKLKVWFSLTFSLFLMSWTLIPKTSLSLYITERVRRFRRKSLILRKVKERNSELSTSSTWLITLKNHSPLKRSIRSEIIATWSSLGMGWSLCSLRGTWSWSRCIRTSKSSIIPPDLALVITRTILTRNGSRTQVLEN